MGPRRLDGNLGGDDSSFWGQRRWLGMALFLGVGLMLGSGYFFVTTEGEPEETGPDPSVVASVDAANGAVDESMHAARDMLTSGRAEAIVRQRRLAEARQADWEEGEDKLIAGELGEDQSVYLAMVGRQIPEASVHRAVTAMEEEFDFRRSRPGDKWRARVDEDGYVQRFRYETSPEDIWIAERDGDGFEVGKQEIDLETRHVTVTGEVEDSFWLTMNRGGHSDILALRFMDAFRYTIDFNTETRNGDNFTMIVEELYLDGEMLRYGKVVAAAYVGERGAWEGYWYESDTEEGPRGYFDTDGESLERMFLRSPLDVSRVTSSFGRRTHPITGDQRMHTGVDYGAPSGSPVQAVADGTIVYAGWNGGYGNFLKIRHSNGYETAYAHLSGFASGISTGTRVQQGQIVARSGNTGSSTGPHLHYEMLQHGRHVNPLGVVDETSGEPLEGEPLETFRETVVADYADRLHEALALESPQALERLTEDDEADEADE